MARLGYERYGAQGGDWGTSISAKFGQRDPEHVAGIHRTPPLAPPDRPQAVGYGLVDSPAALCAWIVEKFWSWTDCHGHPENVLTRDKLLDNLMLYWVPGTGASAATSPPSSSRRCSSTRSGGSSGSSGEPQPPPRRAFRSPTGPRWRSLSGLAMERTAWTWPSAMSRAKTPTRRPAGS